MKKIVSTFIALFVAFIGINAQKVTFEYQAFTAMIPSVKGKASVSATIGDITVTIADTYKNSKTASFGLYGNGETLAARGSSKTEFTLTASINSNDASSNKIIKSIAVYSADVTPMCGGSVVENSGDEFSIMDAEKAFMVIENDYQDYNSFSYKVNLKTEVRITKIEVVYGELVDNVVLSDSEDYPYSGRNIYAKNVTYTRSMGTNHWGTLCLPFKFTLNDDNFAGYYTHSMSNVSEGFATIKKYANGEKITAGLPIVFWTNKSEIVVNSKNVLLSDDFYTDGISKITRIGSAGQRFYACGNLKKVRYENEYVYYVSKDKLIYCGGNANVNIKPYRAFMLPDLSVARYRRLANVRSLTFDVLDEDDNVVDDFDFADNNEVTAVESVESDTQDDIIGIFTSDGKKVNELQKGLNIVKTTNGVKKVYIR